MRLLFVSFYRYSHGKRRRYLKKLFNQQLVTRIKQHDGYLYSIPDGLDLDERQICIH
jgi:hypothetical protein